MGRRMAENRTVETHGDTIGMPVSRNVVKASRPSTGIPQQRDVHEEREMGTLRQRAEEMRRQVADVATTFSGTAHQAARQVEGPGKLNPGSSPLFAASPASTVALVIAGFRPLDRNLRDFLEKIRNHIQWQNEDEWPGKVVGGTTLLSRHPTPANCTAE